VPRFPVSLHLVHLNKYTLAFVYPVILVLVIAGISVPSATLDIIVRLGRLRDLTLLSRRWGNTEAVLYLRSCLCIMRD